MSLIKLTMKDIWRLQYC